MRPRLPRMAPAAALLVAIAITKGLSAGPQAPSPGAGTTTQTKTTSRELPKAQAPAAAKKGVNLSIPVTSVEFTSKAVGRSLKYNIALPDGYERGQARYPVIYLLHGYSGNYAQWNRFGGPRAAKGLGVIVVMPDGGNSWYVNWSGTEKGESNAWEDCILNEVIGHVDGHFRTIARREGRAINGLSMGGFGALSLGLRHPDLFISVGSESGAVAFAKTTAKEIRDGRPPRHADRSRLDTKPRDEIEIPGFRSQAERTPRGVPFAAAEQADAHDPFQLVLKIPRDKLPQLCIDCGTEDPFLDANREFIRLLIDRKIPFSYTEAPGEHIGAYWARQIPHALAIQAATMRAALARD